MSLTVRGGEILESETRSRVAEGTRSATDDVYLGHHRLVFRAAGATATLEVSDAEVAENRTLIYHFLQVQPYFMGEAAAR